LLDRLCTFKEVADYLTFEELLKVYNTIAIIVAQNDFEEETPNDEVSE
jgi:hypothetical protein